MFSSRIRVLVFAGLCAVIWLQTLYQLHLRSTYFEISAIYTFPDVSTLDGKLPSGHIKYEYCRNTFIDLGTNIGDSIGYFVDNSLDPSWMKTFPKTKKHFSRPHLDVTKTKIYNTGYYYYGRNSNPLAGMLQNVLTADPNNIVFPEHTCVYGMEGNPAFTERLQKLENFIMGMKPRPVRHLHIHTESVVTAVDGPTKLFLDKTSVAENFWGSSILSSTDVQKSATKLGNGSVFSADVQGISLSSLVKNTMLPFKPEASSEEKKGGLLIIKMDIEGAEYQVLKEIANSGVICDYIQMGNRVVMIVEFHFKSLADPEEREKERDGAEEAQEKLIQCGVVFGDLDANWA